MKIKFAYTMYRIIITNNFHCTHSSSFHNWRSWILLGTVYMEGRRSQYQEDPRGESSWRQIVKMFSVFSLHVKSCTCKLFVAAFAREKPYKWRRVVQWVILAERLRAAGPNNYHGIGNVNLSMPENLVMTSTYTVCTDARSRGKKLSRVRKGVPDSGNCVSFWRKIDNSRGQPTSCSSKYLD